MTSNKTRPPGASVKEYIASRANERQRADVRELMALLRSITRHSPRMWGPGGRFMRSRPRSTPPSSTAATARRQVAWNASLGVTGLGLASILMTPKIAALVAGNVAVLGTGAVANLALVFGSLMFLREAQRARAIARMRPDDALEPGAPPTLGVRNPP